MIRRRFLAVLLAALPGVAPATTPLRLLMIERQGCPHCRSWLREIGPGYAESPQGHRAPLVRIDLDGPFPDGLALARHPWLTPTFILVDSGREIARIEGYPGARHFYPLLDRMMLDAEN